MSAVADVLNGAADLIERDGWCQSRYLLETGERCADGAIAVAGNGHHGGVRSVARLALRSAIGGESVVIWNDAPGRTKAEVVAALRAAAELAS
jgi:hypothetical protein